MWDECGFRLAHFAEKCNRLPKDKQENLLPERLQTGTCLAPSNWCDSRLKRWNKIFYTVAGIPSYQPLGSTDSSICGNSGKL
jgi:hypothetical protein